MPFRKDHTYKIFKHYINKYNNSDYIEISYNINNEIHNENGAAVLWNDGYKRYVLNSEIIGDNEKNFSSGIYFESDKFFRKWIKLRVYD